MNNCSCGCSQIHKVARRETSDGVTLQLWSDGSVTYALGIYIKGTKSARTSYQSSKNLEAGHLLFSVVELYDFKEVPQLLKSARKAVRQKSDSPYRAMVNYFNGRKIKSLDSGKTFCWV